jgi:benzoate/toluate 1,2-dioxygenase subunit beta
MARAKAKKAKAKAKKAPIRRAAARPAPAKRAAAAANGADTLREVEQLLYRQAELLDGRRWEDFIELFDRDGIYWMPAAPEQTTGEGVPSIFYEDRNMMRVRMKRVTHPHAWSQAPDWGTNHVVSNVMIERERAGEVMVRSRFHMMEFRRDVTRHFAGSYIHTLRKTKDGWRIKRQRVDMVNSQGAYDYVIQVWV